MPTMTRRGALLVAIVTVAGVAVGAIFGWLIHRVSELLLAVEQERGA